MDRFWSMKLAEVCTEFHRINYQDVKGHVWMFHNLPKPQVSPLPKVRRPNRVTQVRQFFLTYPNVVNIQISA
jgi:hypothetical protein